MAKRTKKRTIKHSKSKKGRQFDYKKPGRLSYEGKTAKKDLQNIAKNSIILDAHLRNNDDLPEWIQKKITLANNYINSVSEYMLFKVKHHQSHH